MSYKISDDCIACGACEPECLNQAIKEGDPIYIINPDGCTECVGFYESPQCLDVCPLDAPLPDPENIESREQLLAKWEKLYPGETPQAP